MTTVIGIIAGYLVCWGLALIESWRLMLALAARRLFGSTLLGLSAGLLLAVDGQHLVHSRTGLLDMSVMFFALGGFCALLLDRDRIDDPEAGRGAHLPQVTP